MHTISFERSAGPACVLESHALVEVPLSEIRALREAPAPTGAPELPARFLRHCDEQTVAGVRAVQEAIASQPGPVRSYARYGVIAAPRFAGKITGAQTLSQAAKAGGIAVSPHVVPQCSLHALASAVSVAFGMHGPNLGVSGGPEAVSEGLFAAVSLMGAGGCEGLWLVLTEWEEEPVLDDDGNPLNDPLCRAVAVAVRSPAAHAEGVTFTLGFTDATPDGDSAPAGRCSALVSLSAALGMCALGGVITSWSHVCPWGTEIRIAVAGEVHRSRAGVVHGREAA